MRDLHSASCPIGGTRGTRFTGEVRGSSRPKGNESPRHGDHCKRLRAANLYTSRRACLHGARLPESALAMSRSEAVITTDEMAFTSPS